MTIARELANLLDSSGDVKADSLSNVAAFPTDWTAGLSGSDMVFSHNGVAKFKVTTSGAVVAVDDITAFGSP